MENTKIRTMDTIRTELDNSVEKYNLATDTAERIKLAAEHKTLVEEYNKLSLLSTYAKCMAAELPLVEFAKAYYYTAISVKDAAHEEVINGVSKTLMTRSVKDGDKKLDVTKFIEWTEERNKSVAAAKDWKTKTNAARNAVITEWKKYLESKGDSHAVSNSAIKRAVQDMFDSLVFIKSETGKNAVIATGAIAKWLVSMANSRKDAKVDKNVVITGNILPMATWRTLLLDVLHIAVTGKKFAIVYGDPEGEAQDKKSEAKQPDSKEATDAAQAEEAKK